MRTEAVPWAVVLLAVAGCRPKDGGASEESRHSSPIDSAATAETAETAGGQDSKDTGAESSDTHSTETDEEKPAHWTTFSVESTGICALASNRRGACWGYDQAGELQIPDEEFQSIDMGTGYTCGVLVDGTIACWGLVERGEYD